jgi:uncharacterized membrane protein YbjE (DUF340 family)
MAGSIYISIAFVFGVVLGRFSFLTSGRVPAGAFLTAHVPAGTSTYVLYGLIFFVGITVGANTEVWRQIKKMNARIVLVPLCVLLGTFAGCAVVAPALKGISMPEALAVGAGFGYYSLSSVLIAQLHGGGLGAVAMLSNLMREIFTLLATPFLARFFGRLAPIAAGGATAMDTTLPVISRFSGKQYTVIAVFSGVVLTFLVPILVPVFLTGG